jgi:SagB-type dehydrogenase family enzyme
MKNTGTEAGRQLLKSRWPELKDAGSDKAKGIDPPPIEDPPTEGSELITLPDAREELRDTKDLVRAMEERQTRRSYSGEPLSLRELSFLLWATQGVRKAGRASSLRTVPSGGARHPFETFLFVHRIEGLSAGLYRYLPLEHALTLVRGVVDADAGEKILDEALMAHNFGAAVTFLWAAAPERSEWSYNFEAHRLMLLDAGHICQNLYLACEAVGCGTCAVGAYDQEKSDRFLGIDGTDRFLVYAAPVGKAI